jgi:translation initiation factor IF-2
MPPIFYPGSSLKPFQILTSLIVCILGDAETRVCPAARIRYKWAGIREEMMPQRKRSQLSGSLKEKAHFAADITVPGEAKRRLEIVLKSDSVGSAEAVSTLLAGMKIPEAEIKVIHSGVGAVSKQDLLMALSGSGLVVGFSVGVAPKLDQWVKEHTVEVRLYNVIYRLADDLREIARDMIPSEPDETITGKCRIIAVFKSSKGVVFGCEVLEGSLQVGKNLRMVTAMGPVHSSRIESLQVEKKPVREARPGQQVGVKVPGFTEAKEGDFIECYEIAPPRKKIWSPAGRIVHLESS